MLMQMMLVVHVAMFVRQGIVHMLVLVPLSQMQIQADRHQRPCRKQWGRYGISKQDDGEHRTDERSHREIRPGTGRPKMA